MFAGRFACAAIRAVFFSRFGFVSNFEIRDSNFAPGAQCQRPLIELDHDRKEIGKGEG
jgi:hypothetical protein